jgi:hypothetical protein
MQMDEGLGGNPYLALRAAKIARNTARLLELGLLTNDGNSTTSSREQSAKHQKQKNFAVPLRRSPRSKESPNSYLEPAYTPQSARKFNNPTSSESIEKKVSADESASFDNLSSQIISPPPPLNSFPENSARAMIIDSHKLVHGDGNQKGLLGVTMQHTGKAHVMEESARRAVSSYGEGKISFNKYSGVQEWGNDVLFLWVNLGAPHTDVVNEFLDKGRQVTWFGGSRMHDKTKIIQRLIHVGKRSSSGDESGIVLWCRQYETQTRGFGAYICLGRLSYQSHQFGSSPLSFIWKLLDYNILLQDSKSKAKELFSI